MSKLKLAPTKKIAAKLTEGLPCGEVKVLRRNMDRLNRDLSTMSSSLFRLRKKIIFRMQ